MTGAAAQFARRGAGFVVVLALLLVAALPAAAAPQGEQAGKEKAAAVDKVAVPGHVVAEAGDSWLAIRSRLCPVELFQEANPSLADRPLRPGDRIESPLVSAVELERSKRAYGELEGRLQSEMERSTGLEARVVAFDKLQAELTTSREAEANAQRSAKLLLLGAAGGLLLAAAAGVLAFLLRRDADRAHRRVADSEERYNELRRSLQGLEVQLQKRALDILGVHKAAGLTQQQIADAALPVIEMAERLKRRHAS